MPHGHESGENIGNRIAVRSRELGMSSMLLAEVMEVMPAHVRRWESGERLPPLENLPDLSGALNVRLEWLLTGANSIEEYVATVVEPAQKRLKKILKEREDAVWGEPARRWTPKMETYLPDEAPEVSEGTPARLDLLLAGRTLPEVTEEMSSAVPPTRLTTTSTTPAPLGQLSAIKEALLATITEVLALNTLSDADCLQELARWHERKKGSKTLI